MSKFYDVMEGINAQLREPEPAPEYLAPQREKRRADPDLARQFDRLPPSSIESEMCLLASMMLDSEAIISAREAVNRDAFYQADHQIIWDVILGLYDRGLPIDPVIVREELLKRGKLEEIGGTQYLSTVINQVPSAAHAAHYAAIVREKYLLRLTIAGANDTLREAYAPHEAADVVFARAQGRTADVIALKEALGPAPSPPKPKSAIALDRWGELARQGKLDAIPVITPLLNLLASPLRKGMITMFSGPPKSSKSFWVTQNAMEWSGSRIPFAMKMLEDGEETYQSRLLAQLDGNADLFDPDWVRDNYDAFLAAKDRHQDALDRLATCIECQESDPDNQHQDITYPRLLEWVRIRVSEGARIVVIDPITKVKVGQWRNEEDKKFFGQLANIIAHKASAIIINHTDRMTKRMAGGQSIERFAHNIFELESNWDGKKYRVKDRDGFETTCVPDRILQITGARSKGGTGARLGLWFGRRAELNPSPNCKLVFEDAGILIPGKRGGRVDDDAPQDQPQTDNPRLF